MQLFESLSNQKHHHNSFEIEYLSSGSSAD